MDATKRPWTAHCSHIYAPDGEIICTVNNPGSKESDYPLVANRDLIVRAVNTFDQAREALKLVKQWKGAVGVVLPTYVEEKVAEALAAMEAAHE